MSVMCLSDGSHWPATTAEYQKKIVYVWFVKMFILQLPVVLMLLLYYGTTASTTSFVQWLKWKCRDGELILGFGPLLVVVGPLLTVLDHFAPVGGRGPESTELASLWSNQAFTFHIFDMDFESQNGKTVQKFNKQYAERRLLAYHSVPYVSWKFEVRECLVLKIGGKNCFYAVITAE